MEASGPARVPRLHHQVQHRDSGEQSLSFRSADRAVATFLCGERPRAELSEGEAHPFFARRVLVFLSAVMSSEGALMRSRKKKESRSCYSDVFPNWG